MLWIIFLFVSFLQIAFALDNSPRKELFIKEIDDLSILLERESSNASKIWEIRTTPDLKLKGYCKRLIMDAPNNTCENDYLKITGGEEDFKGCTSTKKFTVLATGNIITLEIVRQNVILVDIECVFTAFSRIFFKDIPSEEVDSREFGMKPGKINTTCDCGKSLKKSSKRIIFDTDSGENEFPWAVSLQYCPGCHFCGGSILTRRHIITSVYCSTAASIASDPVAVVGISHLKNKSPGRKVYPIIEIVDHKDYQSRPKRNDISILITKDSIEFSNAVGPICIPKSDPKIIGKYITAVGYCFPKCGDQQKKAHLRVVNPFECSSFWGNQQHDVKLTQICTWSAHRDIIKKNFGAPITWVDPKTNRYFLVGLPSLVQSTCYQGCNLPTLHTAVHAYYDWITQVVSKMDSPYNKVCTKNNGDKDCGS